MLMIRATTLRATRPIATVFIRLLSRGALGLRGEGTLPGGLPGPAEPGLLGGAGWLPVAAPVPGGLLSVRRGGSGG